MRKTRRRGQGQAGEVDRELREPRERAIAVTPVSLRYNGSYRLITPYIQVWLPPRGGLRLEETGGGEPVGASEAVGWIGWQRCARVFRAGAENGARGGRGPPDPRPGLAPSGSNWTNGEGTGCDTSTGTRCFLRGQGPKSGTARSRSVQPGQSGRHAGCQPARQPTARRRYRGTAVADPRYSVSSPSGSR